MLRKVDMLKTGEDFGHLFAKAMEPLVLGTGDPENGLVELFQRLSQVILGSQRPVFERHRDGITTVFQAQLTLTRW